jgi:hypothetical protein
MPRLATSFCSKEDKPSARTRIRRGREDLLALDHAMEKMLTKESH